MKRIAILLVLLPTMALGQRFELSLNEGFAPATMPAGDKLSFSAAHGDRSETNLFGSLKCLVHVNKWAFGLGIDAHKISVSHPLVNTPNGTTYLHADKKRQQTVLANPAIPFIFIVQRSFSEKPKHRFYGGLNIGVVYTCGNGAVKKESVQTTSGPELYAARTAWRNGFGLTAGISVGYTRYFNNRIGLSFEFRPRYYQITARPSENFGTGNIKFHTVALPVTVGLCVRI